MCLREVDFGSVLPHPEPHRSLVNYNVRTTFSGEFSDPVRHQIRGGFCRLPINVRSRKARYLRDLSHVLGTFQADSEDAKKQPFGQPETLPKSSRFAFEGSQMRQIAFGSHVC